MTPFEYRTQKSFGTHGLLEGLNGVKLPPLRRRSNTTHGDSRERGHVSAERCRLGSIPGGGFTSTGRLPQL